MKRYVCPVCGYVYEGDTPPEKCPQCGVPGSKFREEAVQAGKKTWACAHGVGDGKVVFADAVATNCVEVDSLDIATEWEWTVAAPWNASGLALFLALRGANNLPLSQRVKRSPACSLVTENGHTAPGAMVFSLAAGITLVEPQKGHMAAVSKAS